VIRHLLAQDQKLWLSRSWTTRGKRPHEDDDAYTFVDHASFEARIAAGGFLEWVKGVGGEYYGTPLPEPPDGYDVLFEIDVSGARQVLERCDNVLCVLLVPPSPEAQEARLRARGDPEDSIRRRLELAAREIAEGQEFADAVVVNDDLDAAAVELGAIINVARRRLSDESGTGPDRPGPSG
jgi:guanylate kinase